MPWINYINIKKLHKKLKFKKISSFDDCLKMKIVKIKSFL